MKEKYTIGETAELLGVTTQTLRYYDKIGILCPEYIDENNNYRYYSYSQFHYIDKIKYLQKFGLSLDEIKIILQDRNINNLISYLKVKKEEKEKEIKNLKSQIKDIDWYINYFIYVDKDKITNNVYKRYLPKRYIIKAPVKADEELANMEIRLAEVKSNKEYNNLNFHRQYGYKLNFESFMKSSFAPYEYFVFLNEKPDIDSSLYDELPEGEWICFKTQVLNEKWDPRILDGYIPKNKNVKMILALEFEDDLSHDWLNAYYEVQILL